MFKRLFKDSYTGPQSFSNTDLRALILPLLAEQLLAMLVGMADTVMVSSAGEAAISGVSIVNDVNNLLIAVLSALAGGGAVTVSQYLGCGDRRQTDFTASQLVMISGLIAVCASAASLLFYRQILHALYSSVEPDVMAAAETYFWITALSFPFLGIYNSSAAIYRSMNRTNVTMNVSILMNAINVAGNALGIFVLHLGVAGVAWPTVISRVVAAVVMTSLCFNKKNAISISMHDIFSWNGQCLNKILLIAVPNATENGLFQLGKIIISVFVSTYGTMQIAANGVTNSLSVFSYATESAMILAVVPVIGQCIGKNDYEQAKFYIRKMLKLSYLMAIANSLCVFLLSPFALKLYSISPETALLTRTIICTDCIAIAAIHPLSFVIPTATRAAGDARYTMIIGIISMFTMRVFGAYLLGTVFGFGLIGTRVAWYLDWAFRSFFFIRRYRSGKWMYYRVVGS
jgi:putative MATE family efflux protein